MNKIKILALGLMGAAIVSCGTNSANEEISKEVKALEPSGAVVDSVSYLMGLNFGSFVKSYNLGKLNYDQVIAGMKDFVNAKGTPGDADFAKQFKINPADMQRIMTEYGQMRNKYTLALNAEKEVKFFEEVAKKANVQKTENGVYYIINEPGTGDKITLQDTVYCHYKGSLPNGHKFDEVADDKPSAKFMLNQVITGWKEALQLIGPGGSMQIFIPSKLAYGEYGQMRAGIEPNTPLIFEVKIDSVKVPAPVAPVNTKSTSKKK